MDALDRTILEHLEFDGRSSMQDLSELTGLSRSAVFTRVKRLEEQGVIGGYTVRVNRKKLGFEIRAYCNVSLKLHERELLEEFEANIGSHREVRSCYHLAGSFDYLVEVEVPNMDAYHRFITRKLAAMPNIATVQSMFVMKDILRR
jgi:DNA-binding Lrp family transcriptional regulator